MFVVQFYLPGAASLVFTVVILQFVVINNPQTFDASALLNSFVFIPLFFIYLYGISYITNAPNLKRPYLNWSVDFLKVPHLIPSTCPDHHFIKAYKKLFIYMNYKPYRRRSKLGEAVDKELFPNTDFDQIEETWEFLVFNVRWRF